MNNRGQVSNEVGAIIVIAVTLIVGVILFQVIAQQVGSTTNTITVANESTGVAASTTPQYITSYRALNNVIFFNATGDVPIPSTNYTLTNNVIDPTTGGISVNLTRAAVVPQYNGIWTFDATAQPTTYIPESGGRAVAALIVIFFALAIAIVALSPTVKGKLLEMIGK